MSLFYLCVSGTWKQGVSLSVSFHGFTCSGDAESRHPDSNPEQSFHRCHDGSHLMKLCSRRSPTSDVSPSFCSGSWNLFCFFLSAGLWEWELFVSEREGEEAGGPFRVRLRLAAWSFPHVCPHMGGSSPPTLYTEAFSDTTNILRLTYTFELKSHIQSDF